MDLMRQSKRKTKKPAGADVKRSPAKGLDFSRAGMPAKDSVLGVQEVGKGKKTYRIIHTNEVDEYDRKPPRNDDND